MNTSDSGSETVLSTGDLTQLDRAAADVVRGLEQRLALPTVPRLKRVVNVPIVLGAQGTALTTTTHVFFRMGLNGSAQILSWSLAGTVGGIATAGSVTLDIQVGSTLGGVLSICGSRLPALNGQSELDDQPPATGWTSLIADPQWLLVRPTIVDGVLEVVGLSLRVAVGSH